MLTTQQLVASNYLALQKYLIALENKRLLAATCDTPCHGIEETEKKILFFLWAFESLDCFSDEELPKFLSKASSLAGNCSTCSVDMTEITAWLLTEKGLMIISKL
jgi:hypothetical protein